MSTFAMFGCLSPTTSLQCDELTPVIEKQTGLTGVLAAKDGC
jgi:tartrate dehydratase beta subunit/fumarate hydratase class I family protein